MAGAQDLFFICFLLPGAFCNGFTAQMPKRIEALSGSCVLIPCTFEIPDERKDELKEPVNGVWIKHASQFAGQGTVVFNKSRAHSENILGGQILGDLRQKNCTTVLDNIPQNFSDKYFFRIETAFQATFPDSPIDINVKESPQKPQLTNLMEVKENTPVNLTCTAAAPCHKLPPVLAWSPQLGNTLDQLQENSDKTKSVSSVMTFTASHLHHGKTITCTAEYPLQENNNRKSVKETRTLNILFSPKGTTASVSPSGPVEKGNSVTLTCSSRANPAVQSFTWFRVTENQATQIGSGQILTFNVTDSDGGSYYCEAQNHLGTERSANVLLPGDGLSSISQVIGGVLGAIGLLFLCILILIFCRKRKSGESKASMRTNDTVQKNNIPLDTNESMKAGKKTEVLESEPEEVQYVELEASKLRAKDAMRRDQEERQGQESEYSEVRVSDRQGQPPQQAVNGVEELYAQVNPKHRR